MKEGFSMLLLIIADKKRKESQLPQGMKKCPYCQNLIDKKATVCHYCHRKVSSENLFLVLFILFALLSVLSAFALIMLFNFFGNF